MKDSPLSSRQTATIPEPAPYTLKKIMFLPQFISLKRENVRIAMAMEVKPVRLAEALAPQALDITALPVLRAEEADPFNAIVAMEKVLNNISVR